MSESVCQKSSSTHCELIRELRGDLFKIGIALFAVKLFTAAANPDEPWSLACLFATIRSGCL